MAYACFIVRCNGTEFKIELALALDYRNNFMAGIDSIDQLDDLKSLVDILNI
jgi:hypothetical protein